MTASVPKYNHIPYILAWLGVKIVLKTKICTILLCSDPFLALSKYALWSAESDGAIG